jgi:Ca2+-binding RTX toxin-like protein
MIADWIALGDKYGTSPAAFAGDTVWGFGTTVVGGVLAGLAAAADENAFTVFDAGGSDTLDFSGYAADQRIDLAPESVSDVGGLVGNMGIARGTLIENARGGGGRDRIAGNDAANVLAGNGGNDSLAGGAGNDSLAGGNGRDLLAGENGKDTLAGGTGNDTLAGGAGKDLLTGGAGKDVFDFAAGDSPKGSACDSLKAGDGGAAFDGAGAAAGDRIDVSDLYSGTLAFGGGTGTGHLWCTTAGTATVVYANTDADAAADFQLRILDEGVRASAYAAGDFIL